MRFHYDGEKKDRELIDKNVEKLKFIDFCTTHFHDWVHIYTDGSKNIDSLLTSSAMYIPEIGYEAAWRLHHTHSIVTSEMYAIWRAIQFLIEHFHNCKAVIFTDSLSSLFLIKNNDSSYKTLSLNILESLITFTDKGIDLVIQWIPSHIGTPGNEYVDSIAKRALLLPNITYISCPLSDRVHQCNIAL